MRFNRFFIAVLIVLTALMTYPLVGCGPTGGGAPPQEDGAVAAPQDDGGGQTNGEILTENIVNFVVSIAAILADGVTTATITVELQQANGAPVPQGTPVKFSTTVGSFENTAGDDGPTIDLETKDATGTVSVRIKSDTKGIPVITITSGDALLRQENAIEFIAVTAAIEDFTAVPDVLPADDVTTALISVKLRDASNVPVPQGTVVRFETTLGTFGDGSVAITLQTEDNTGQVSVELKSDAKGAATITVTSFAVVVVREDAVTFSGNLTGTVVNESGQPISGAGVTVLSDPVSDVTDNDGEFDFDMDDLGAHTVVVSRSRSIDNFDLVELVLGSVADSYYLLQDSLVASPNRHQDQDHFITSNTINGQIATLAVPDQPSGFTVGDQTGLVEARISIEYLDLQNPLPFPLPARDNRSADLNNNILIDRQAPSVVVAVKETFLSLVDDDATLTLPNPDNLPNNTRLLWLNPEEHRWEEGGEPVGTGCTIATINAGICEIAHGGIYGLFTETEARVGDVHGNGYAPGTIVFVGDQVDVADASGEVDFRDVHVPFGDIPLSVAVFDPATGALVPSTVTPEVEKQTAILPVSANVGSVTVTAGNTSLVADGNSFTTITAEVRDRSNNLLADTPVNFSVSPSNAGNPVATSTTTDADGLASFQFRVGTNDGVVTISAEADGVTGSIGLQLTPAPRYLALEVSQTTVKSDNSDSATITATVLDFNLSPVEGATVAFSVGGGMISSSSVQTDAGGKAAINFSSGAVDKRNQTVFITATVEGVQPIQIPVQIVGTSLALETNSNQLLTNATTNLLASLKDAKPQGIFGAVVTVTVIQDAGDPAAGLTVQALPQVTDAQGRPLTDANGQLELLLDAGNDTGKAVIQVEALGEVATQEITVGAAGEVFRITAPADDPFGQATGVPLWVTVAAPDFATYTEVTFATSLGGWTDFGGASVVDVPIIVNAGEGTAQARISSPSAGSATVQVFYKGQPNLLLKDSTMVEFFAPASETANLALQASSTVIDPSSGDFSNSVTIIATVTNAAGQVVGNAPVAFGIDADTSTGGGEFISPVLVFTDSSGVAQTTFTSGTRSSDKNGVIITANVNLNPLTPPDASDDIAIVIGGTAGSVVISQGSTILSVAEDTAYQLPMSVLVADTNGNPQSGITVSLGLWPSSYATGFWLECSAGCCVGITGIFPNEDINRNLDLDAGEDLNGNGELTPPNSSAGSLPATVVTDENGLANFDLFYLKSSAAWIEDEITATALVFGTETKSTYKFRLPWLIDDAGTCSLPHSPYNRQDLVATINLTADPVSIAADGTSGSLITAEIYDGTGAPVIIDTDLTVTTNMGDLDTANPGPDQIITVTASGGAATFTLTSSTDLGNALVQVEADTVNASIMVPFVPDVPANFQLTADPGNLVVGATSNLQARVEDTFGHAVADGWIVKFSAAEGMVPQSATTINGIATVVYTAPASTGAGSVLLDTVQAWVEDFPAVQGEVDLTISTLVVGNIDLESDEVEIHADGGVDSATLTVTVTYSDGTLVADGTDVLFSTSAGDFDNLNAGPRPPS